MNVDHSGTISRGLGTSGVVVLAILLAGMRLLELIPFPPPRGGSLQNWRIELAVAIFLVICSLWIVKNRKSAVETLSVHDNHVAVTMWCLVGFTTWSAISVLWAPSSASVLLHTLTWFSFIAVLIFSLVLFRTKSGFHAVGLAALAVSSTTAVFCVLAYYRVSNPGDITIIRINYARFAECFVSLSPLLCVWILYVRRKSAVLPVITGWLLSWLVVMLSTSKGAFIAGIVGHVVLFLGCILMSKYPIRRKMAALAGLWIAFTLAAQIALAAFSLVPTATEYISGEADPTRETSLMRIFTWQVSFQMFANSPIVGVGANNYGIEFNKARILYFGERSEDNTPDLAEWYAVERAHNEFLQILAELGLVGGILFVGAFLSFGIMVIRSLFSNGFKLPPLLWASLAGMAAFFASSFVSSFSFRIAQNGVFFFILFALGINEVSKMRRVESPGRIKWIGTLFAVSILGTVGMMVLLGSRAYANYLIGKAAEINDVNRAMPLYLQSKHLDPDNHHLHRRVADRLAGQGLYGRAAQEMRTMIDRGGGTTVNYSVMADFLIESGQYAEAEAAYREGVAIYPTSVFMRVRYATFLEERGRQSEADQEIRHAKRIDVAQANGWYHLLRAKGDLSEPPATEPMASPNELMPQNARNLYISQRRRKSNK